MKKYIYLLALLSILGINANGQKSAANIPVSADFTIDSSAKPNFCFNYLQIPAVAYRWGFYHTCNIKKEHLVFVENPAPNYKDGKICKDFTDSFGFYWVCLETSNFNGIRDTVCKKIWNVLQMDGAGSGPPTVFTPDDKDNKSPKTFLTGLEHNPEVETFELVIFDRWGAKVFETKDKTNGWNGKVNNLGQECKAGTYYYTLKYQYKDKPNEEPSLNGTVQLFR